MLVLYSRRGLAIFFDTNFLVVLRCFFDGFCGWVFITTHSCWTWELPPQSTWQVVNLQIQERLEEVGWCWTVLACGLGDLWCEMRLPVVIVNWQLGYLSLAKIRGSFLEAWGTDIWSIAVWRMLYPSFAAKGGNACSGMHSGSRCMMLWQYCFTVLSASICNLPRICSISYMHILRRSIQIFWGNIRGSKICPRSAERPSRNPVVGLCHHDRRADTRGAKWGKMVLLFSFVKAAEDTGFDSW